MIYHFPDLETLRLAITSGVVPTDVSLAPAKGGLDDDGQVWLEPSVALPRKAQTSLRQLGVEIVRANGQLEGDEYICWLQLLPVARADNPVPSPQTPVVFELPEATQLPLLVGEMLRLGNDRQGFRMLKDAAGSRVLLRVIGPPYYSLLRALERNGDDGPAPRAYLERSPRVWVEFGYTHPLVDKLRPKEGRFVLMRPPREWTVVEEAAFQDIYDILDFPLPQEQVAWQNAELKSRIRVPLRLASAGTSEPPELWVLRDDAVAQLDNLVREADDHLLNQLAFAVGSRDGKTRIVLRVRQLKKHKPPHLVLNAESYRPFKKMENLFLPHGRRLQPPLRRDVVRKLLAEDPAQIVWLAAQPDGGFVPESLPDQAFRPLRDWVEYVVDQEHAPLEQWVKASRFEFAAFVCKDDPKASTPKGPAPERKRPEGQKPEAPTPAAEPAAARPKGKGVDKTAFVEVPQVKPSALKARLQELEQQFLVAEGELDAGPRLALWPELAALNAALDQPGDAAICWLNALWERDQPAWAQQWVAGETKATDAKALDVLLKKSNPEPDEVRTVAARVIAHPEEAAPRLPALRHFLETNEHRVGVRAAWLAWVSLTKLSHGDVLGLTRARDRLLERLLAKGLNMEHDLPTFLRYAGNQSGDRLRTVRTHLLDIRQRAHAFIEHSYHVTAQTDVGPDPETFKTWLRPEAEALTKAYCDLTFAFGLARLGETDECHKLHKTAEKALDTRDPVHGFLVQAFGYRIDQGLRRQPHSGPLPTELLQRLDRLETKQRYAIDHLRRQSRLLDPHERIDSTRRLTMSVVKDEVEHGLLLLQDLHDPAAVRKHVEQFLARDIVSVPANVRLKRLAAALAVQSQLGETVTLQILEHLLEVLPTLAGSFNVFDTLELVKPVLDRGLFLAAHYGQSAMVQSFLDWFLRLFAAQVKKERGTVKELDVLLAGCFHGLRKLGLRDEISRLLHQVADLVLQGQSLDAVRKRTGVNWPPTVGTLLHIASGWLYFGRVGDAVPILDTARELLFTEPLKYFDKNPLACAYAAALGQAPVDLSLAKFQELFPRIGRIWDSRETRYYFSQSQLHLIESVVLAMASDDFVLGPNARRWLDEDEYLVRRRIHRDLRTFLAQAGV